MAERGVEHTLVLGVGSSERVFRVVAHPLEDHDGERILATIQDVSPLEAQRRDLAAYAHMLEQAQAVADIGSYRWDRVTGEIWWSTQLFRIMGQPLDHEPTVDGFDAQVHPDDREGLRSARKGWRAGPAVAFQLRIVRPDGVIRRVQIHRQEVLEPSHTTFGIIQDVTERFELEQRLRAAETYEAVGRLAAGVAHDFNNLLTVIVGDVGLLQEAHAITELDGVLSAAGRATELTSRLLSLGRSLQAPLVPMELDDAVEEMGQTLRERLPDALTLEIRAGSGASIRADREQLRQALLNLIVEARDAMDGTTGTIEIRTRRTRGGAVVEIEDGAVRGPMEADDRPFRGIGLGRAMVEGAVANMRGRLDVAASASGGTIVRIWFPLTEKPAPALEGDAAPAGLRVLVVEDEPAVQRLAARVLGRVGMTVSLASDPAEAATLDGPFDVVLSDVVMPEGGGLAVLRDIEDRLPGTPIVFMTGYAEEASWLSGQQVLHKPFQPQQLVRFIRSAAASKPRAP
ncbi:MAG: response regulator [Alphaproteobacteria bacterium]|nr:response regulator [Alphaproteobacteria bacterium]